MHPCPTLSVVVPGYQNSELSRQVLTDILRNVDVPDFEVIFVDDGSTDDTPGIQGQFPQVKYIRHPENRGVSPAWNTGVQAATGDFISILNNDVRINDPHWMSKLVDAARDGRTIAGPELVDFNSASNYNGRNVPYINGWCYIFPRRLFSEIGYFEEAFAPASFEDIDICARAVHHGYTLKQIDLRIQHTYSATVAKFLRERMPGLNERNKRIWTAKMQAMTRRGLRITIDCPSNGRKWGPYSMEEDGLGGAEVAFTLLTRELALRGHEVLAFNDAEHGLGIEGEGVRYFNRRDLPTKGLDCDVFVVYRCPSEHVTKTSAVRKIFWSTDQTTTPPATWERDIFPHVDEVVCISDYHADYMAAHYSVPRDRITVIGCPVRSWDYEPHTNKDPNLFIFCSVPHRGLKFMPTVMREIRKSLPEARLVITSDYRLWGAPDPRNEEFRPLLSGEDFRGMVPRSELIPLQLAAAAQPYPCTYEEMFCIAVAECSAAGATPISTQIGAVPQTLGDQARIVGPPDGDFAQRLAARTLEVHGNTDIMRQAIEHSWNWSVVRVASEWEKLFYGQLVEHGVDDAIRSKLEVPGPHAPYPVGDITGFVPSA